MDRNTLLAFVLSMAVFTGWIMLQAENQPPREDTPTPAAVAEEATGPSTPTGSGSGPVSDPAGSGAAVAPAPLAAVAEAAPIAPAVPAVELWTKTLDRGGYQVVVTNRGAALKSWTLTDPVYDQWIDGEVRPMQLFKIDEQMAVMTTPFLELGLGDLSKAIYRVESSGPDGASFVFEKDGILVRKKYTFAPNGYDFTLDVEVVNGSSRSVQPRFEVFWPAMGSDEHDFDTQALITLQAGEKESEAVTGVGVIGFFGDAFGGRGDGPVEYQGDIDWAGIDIKYFIGALAPDRPRSAQVRFEPIVEGKVGATILGFEALDLPPGQSLDHSLRGYIGPKEPERLVAFGSGLDLSIDRGYGWLVPLTSFFQWLLTAFYSVIPNYGWAIILMTILVRLVTAPIMMRQMRSMERMRKVQPQLKELQEKHSDDRQKQSEEMMALYKREGVNPLGGCLPMLLQFPVFIGLFFALQSSIALRHAPFILWMNDLSAPETLFTLPVLDLPVRVLPIVMGASMVLQQRMQPMAMDPAQARMMMTVMPIMMTVLFYQFPSGLVLYWMISNFLGIGHQVWVGKRMGNDGGTAAVVAGAKAVSDKASDSSANGKRGKKGKKKSDESLRADG